MWERRVFCKCGKTQTFEAKLRGKLNEAMRSLGWTPASNLYTPQVTDALCDKCTKLHE